MPELKRLFVRGRMNKDLDERLLPSGEYRDALNIQVGSSEGSDVGAIQNILGNQVRKEKKGLPSTDWALDSETANYYGLPLDAKCIGGVKDDINDKLYWFVTSSTVDCILEYEDTYKVVRPVLVDTQNILNFSVNKLITGVNILDKYLFWTDDNSEPKKLEVTPRVFNSVNFTTHSTYEGRDFVESDITVIKKAPLNAPVVALSNDARGGGNAITQIIQNFSSTAQNTGGLATALAIGTTVSGINLSPQCTYLVGDKLILTGEETNNEELGEFFLVRAEVTSRAGVNNLTDTIAIKILSITEQVKDDDLSSWKTTLLQEEPLFELKFPRFAYRWKYKDNQFSAFSPFTQVAFLPTIYDYNAQKGYNEGMKNTIGLITLSSFDTPSENVKAVEILYKETNNSAVYVVDDIVLADDPGFTQYEIKSELIYKIVESNQLLRPWDNVPRLAKSQEIVGNRLIYGNYLQNYTVNSGVKFHQCTLGLDNSDGVPTKYKPLTSIKSLRTYQIGVVFKDEYGRETPVFTDNSGIIKTTLGDSFSRNKIQVQAGATSQEYTTIAPWASHFKFFVKENSNEYYNLAADRIYESGDATNVWVSFPSSERNKVTPDTYLILKKGHETDVAVTASDNKYKVIAISNEAPAELTTTKNQVGIYEIEFDSGYGNNSPLPIGAAAQAGASPVQGNLAFLIARADGKDEIKLDLRENLVPGNYIKFTVTGAAGSNYYKIASVQYDKDIDNATDKYEAKVFVDSPFQGDINLLYADDNTLLSQENTIQIYKDGLKDTEAQFQGRFFVKLEKNKTLTDNLFLDSNLIVANTTRMYSDEGGGDPDNYGYINNSTNIRIFGGGAPSVIYGPNANNISGKYGGFLPHPNNSPNPAWAYDETWELIIEKKNNNRYDQQFIASIQTVGTKLKFANAVEGTPTSPGNIVETGVYTIKEVRSHVVSIYGTAIKTRYFLKFEETLQENINPAYLAYHNASFPGVGTTHSVNMKIMEVEFDSAFSSDNPAVFETEPKEAIDLNIYYEASGAIPVAQYHNLFNLDYHNVFIYGNGVESNRIRDDFNAPTIDKGTKASTVLEEPYEEERRATGLIYSGIFNSNSGLNNLNQFIQAEKITKDLNPIYGSIQKLHTRDTNLVALCEDKILRILANKDALYNADGNANVTSTNNVLGQAVPFAGEYGISKNPESFASFGFRAYFSDKKRSSVLRLSMDGLTEISSKGMNDFFYDNLKEATTIIGNYDVYSDCYNLTLNSQTVSFKEATDGWPTRKSFIPEFGISLNSDYYTISNGMLWSHDNPLRNTFYEGAVAKSSVKLIFNDIPSKIKNFKTLSYEGDSGWISPLIQTDQQDGAVTTFLDKENIYYNYIRGLNDTWDNNGQVGTLDLKQFAAQGIGQPTSIAPYTGNTTFTVTVKNDPNN